jgi:hypothetical protein
LSSVLTVTSLGSQALAVPGDGMSREQTTSEVDLPDIPESTALADDASADKALSLGDEQQIVPSPTRRRTSPRGRKTPARRR